MGASVIMVRDTELCLESRYSHRLCLFGLISSLFTLLIRGQKLALIMLFAANDSFNCSCHKNVRKENFPAKYFQLDKVENVALPRC